jgi:2-polyprenyl-6-methoxyphenol hydroxylase-like FAD-dependent oxidoreductase
VSAIRQSDPAVSITFDDGSEAATDLVIGADGQGSVVRQAVGGVPASNHCASYVAWRGLFPEGDLPTSAASILVDRFALFPMPHSHILGYIVAGPNSETDRGSRRYNWI